MMVDVSPWVEARSEPVIGAKPHEMMDTDRSAWTVVVVTAIDSWLV
jgi:hypothetical protein